MDIRENIKESWRSMRLNKLRSALTIATIGIGITCLVGMLTTVEAMRQNYLKEYARMGVNSFTIHSVRNWRNRRRGIIRKDVPRLKYSEAKAFRTSFDNSLGTPGVRVGISGNSELLRGSRKTHPNIRISGVDENYLAVEYMALEKGRNFTPEEVDGGGSVAIIGEEVYSTLYARGEDPIDSYIIAYGTRYRVIGKIQEMGKSEESKDRFFLVPLQEARRLERSGDPWIEIVVAVHDLGEMETAMGSAIQIMRSVRRDLPVAEDSFEIEKSDEAEREINQQMAILRMIGYIIGSITLIGACVGLMNIMLIYVRERTREIGLRKAVGATPYEIRMQFLTEAVFVCQLGGVVGIFFGLVVGNLTALLMSASFIFPFSAVLMGVFVSTLVGVLAGYIPAKNAARVDPIESLRYE